MHGFKLCNYNAMNVILLEIYYVDLIMSPLNYTNTGYC